MIEDEILADVAKAQDAVVYLLNYRKRENQRLKARVEALEDLLKRAGVVEVD